MNDNYSIEIIFCRPPVVQKPLGVDRFFLITDKSIKTIGCIYSSLDFDRRKWYKLVRSTEMLYLSLDKSSRKLLPIFI